MRNWFKGLVAGAALAFGLGRGEEPPRGRLVRARPFLQRPLEARYDAATITDENRRHWANADGLSANAANSPEVRRRLRNNARYEVANNSYARGIVLTLANDCVGTGPRLQMLTESPEANRQIEAAFAAWADAVGLAEKLRTLRMAKTEDGEGFALLTTNPAVGTPVKLDLRLVEAEQVATPGFGLSALGFGNDRSRGAPDGPKSNAQSPKSSVDGIVFDAFANPVEYHVLRRHPGDTDRFLPLDPDRIKARSVIHYFRADRPGQARGIPEVTAALPLFAQLRRYTLAVIAAAESAAEIALVIYTDAPANGEADTVEAMDTIDLEKRMATVMPGGWKLGQTHAEQPATTYAEFKHEILNEIARCLNMPFNVAAGNSSGYNYASGRLDHQTYFKSVRVEQAHIESVVLDRILSAWLAEALLIEGFLPDLSRDEELAFTHQWFWDGHEHVDPAKEANAQETRLRNHTTTLAEEYAKRGRDWEAELRQRAKEAALMKELGLTQAEPAKPGPVAEPKDAEEPGEEKDDGGAEARRWRGKASVLNGTVRPL